MANDTPDFRHLCRVNTKNWSAKQHRASDRARFYAGRTNCCWIDLPVLAQVD